MNASHQKAGYNTIRRWYRVAVYDVEKACFLITGYDSLHQGQMAHSFTAFARPSSKLNLGGLSSSAVLIFGHDFWTLIAVSNRIQS